MAAANLTADRTDVLELNSTGSINLQSAATALTIYRGGAVGVVIDGASGVGYPTKTFDGTVMANFMGVAKRGCVITSASAGYQLGIPLKRDGAVLFNLVDSSGDAATAAVTDVGKPCWFVSDNQVCLTPPAALYPIYAGRIIGYTGTVGIQGSIGVNPAGTTTYYGGPSTTQVLVEIEDAVRRPSTGWNILPFVVDAAVLSTNNLDYVNAFTFGRRVWLGRLIIQTGIALTVNNLTVIVKNGSTSLNSTGKVITQSSNAVGSTYTDNLYNIVDYNDTLTINVAATGDSTAGLFTMSLEYLPLQ